MTDHANMPTKAGVFYGRPRFKHPSDCAIEPRLVRNRGDGSIINLYVQEQYIDHDPQFYDWFGPVPAHDGRPQASGDLGDRLNTLSRWWSDNGDRSGTDKALAEAADALSLAPQPDTVTDALTRLRNQIDISLDNYIVEMKPSFDDSVTGFNEAWEVVRKAFDAAIQKRDGA